GIPPAELWAYDPRGRDQVGCIYTAQGFEFDYVGVIFGKDLTYDLDAQCWVGDRTKSHDTVVKRSKEQFVSLVKNTYRRAAVPRDQGMLRALHGQGYGAVFSVEDRCVTVASGIAKVDRKSIDTPRLSSRNILPLQLAITPCKRKRELNG